MDVAQRTDSEVDDCFMDVRRQVDEHGGSVQHGWMIWEWPGISAEGVFHAVWRKPDDQLLDVAFKKDGESRILFAPDTKRVFDQRRIPTIRMAIGRDPRIKQWIEINERFDRLVSRQMRGVPFGTEVIIEGKAFDLRKQADLLSLAFAESREARRAGGGLIFPSHGTS